MFTANTRILVLLLFLLSFPLLSSCAAVVASGSTLAIKGLPRAELEKKAETGDAQAQYELGLANCCMGVGFSTQVATEWLCKAADQGHPDAMYELGRIYLGEVSRTPSLAQKLRRLAIAKESQAHAYIWLSQAKQNGHEKAVKKLRELEEKISLEDKEHAVFLFYDRENAACKYNQVFAVELPNIFHSGTPAVAAEVNGNFSALATAINDTESRVLLLEDAVEELQLRDTTIFNA